MPGTRPGHRRWHQLVPGGLPPASGLPPVPPALLGVRAETPGEPLQFGRVHRGLREVAGEEGGADLSEYVIGVVEGIERGPFVLLFGELASLRAMGLPRLGERAEGAGDTHAEVEGFLLTDVLVDGGAVYYRPMPLRPETKSRLQALAVCEFVVLTIAFIVQLIPRRGTLELYHLPPDLRSGVTTALLLTVAMNALIGLVAGAVWAYTKVRSADDAERS